MNIKMISMKKILIYICGVIILSFNAIATSISDNDGSAFITKAEFDSLKNSFQVQIDTYNQGIDSKIDAAISSYLAGVRISPQSILQIYSNDWEKVTMMNYDIGNVWQYPSVNLNLNMNHYGQKNDAGSSVYSNWGQTGWIYLSCIYNRPTSMKSKRILVEAGPESNTMPSSVIWKGRAFNYIDKIIVSNISLNKAQSTSDRWFWNASSGKLYRTNVTKLVPNYYADYDTMAKNVWGARFYYSESSAWYTKVSSWYSTAASTNIDLEEVSNKTTEYDHILHLNNISNIYCSDVDWKRSIRSIPDTSYTREALKGMSVIGGKWSIIEGHQDDRTKTNINRSYNGTYSGDYGNTDTNAIVTVGLVNQKYDSGSIYQHDVLPSINVNGKVYTESTQPNLYNGFLCFAANKGDRIKWDQKFIDYKVGGTTETDIDLNVYMAVGKFSTGTSLASGSVYIKEDSQIENYKMTNHRGEVSWDFSMPIDGIVYCKWLPATTVSGNWEVSLDINNSKNYELIKH